MEKIIDKINKLLAKTIENGATPAEAERSLIKARELMLKYKIEKGDLEQKNNDTSNIIKYELPHNMTIKWVLRLIDIFLSNFGVISYLVSHANGTRTMVLFGIKEDVECVATLFTHAYNFVDYESKKYATHYRKKYGSAKGIKNSYIYGFIKGLFYKYEEQNKSNDNYALMVQVPVVVKNTYEDITKDMSVSHITINTSIKHSHNQEAMSAGYKAGKTFGTTGITD